MRTLITLVVVLFCLQLWAQVPDTTSVAPGRLIIKVNQAFQTIGTRSDGIIETDQTWFNNLAVQYQIDVLRQMYAGSTRAYQQNKYLICFPDSIDLETIVTSFDLQSSVQDVRYDFYVHLCTNDPFNSYQWNMQRIKANDSYYTLAGSIQAPQAVRIAVVDTGIDFNHPDLTNNILRDQNNNVIGTNLVFSGQPAMDDHGHGTLVAGLIAAQTNNVTGISSLVTGSNVKIMPIKAFDYNRIGLLSDVCEGIEWAIANGANIINCSWVVYTLDVPISELSDIIDDPVNAGVLFIAARGVNGTTYPGYWSATRANVIAVGGSNNENTKEFSGSSGTNWISVCAPSGSQFLWDGAHDSSNGVVSTLPLYNSLSPYRMHYSQNQSTNDPFYNFQCGGWTESPSYDFLKGTSLSAAHVSGLMGMLWAKYYSEISNETMDMQDIKDILVKSAQDFHTNDYTVYNGWGSGIINAQEALMTPHPNLSLRQYQIGPDDIDDRYDYPIDEYVWNLPSMEWGSSQSIKLQIKNKWVAGTNVRVSMSTTDPNITFSYPGEIDRYSIGNIAAETTIWTENMWIRDWSNQVRTNIPITITIRANEMPDRVYILYINILQNTASIVSSITMLQGETITTDLVVSNLDGVGDDELLAGTSAGRLFCYKNNVWNHVGTLPQSITVNPSIGDINADGHKEIVAVDLFGNVHVYDKTFAQLRTFPYSMNEVTVGSSILEDVTGDNILDIIYSTNGTSYSVVKVIDFVNLATLSHQTNMITLATPAVGDVDHESGYEIVVPYKLSNPAWFRFQVLKIANGSLVVSVEKTSTTLIADSALPPSIVDINEDGIREIAFMVNSTDGNAFNFFYSIPADIMVDSSQLFSTTIYNREVAKVIGLSSNIASIYSKMSVIYNPNYTEQYGLAIANGLPGSPGGFPLTIPTSTRILNVLADDLLTHETGIYPQQLVLMSGNTISYYKLTYNPSLPNSFNFLEAWDYRTFLGNSVSLISMATANKGSNRILYAISQGGILYGYSFGASGSNKTDCSQRRQSSRHTGCYEQPIPKEVHGNITIKHPFIVDKQVTAYSSVFTINEGVVGRFEAENNLTLNRSSFNIIGSEEKPVIIRSLGGGSDNEYWKGINVTNGSNLDMNWAEVTGSRQALDISYTGNRFIKNSKFYNNLQNVNCYNATVNMFNNYLTDAIHALSAYHYASPMLNSTVLLQNGLNEIAGNEYGVFSDSSTPVLKDGHNNLENDRYNLYLQNLPLMSGPIHAENNWWGHTDLREVTATINPANRVAFLPYDMQPNLTIIREDQGSSMFEDGFAYMLN